MRAALIAALLVPVAAAAQTAPPSLPTRSVTVQYGLQGGPAGGPEVVHMSFDAASQRMRMETPGAPGYTVVDHGAGQNVTTVDPAGAAAQVPMPATAPGRLPTQGAVAQGQGSLNGTSCTVWNFTASGSSVCVTDDGVPLYGDGTDEDGRPRRFAATRVDYGTPSVPPPRVDYGAPSVAPPVASPERRVERREASRGDFLPGLGFHFGGGRR